MLKKEWDPRVKPREGDTERAPSQMHADRVLEVWVKSGDLGHYNEGQCNDQVVLPHNNTPYQPAIATGNLDGNKALDNNLIYDRAGLVAQHYSVRG